MINAVKITIAVNIQNVGLNRRTALKAGGPPLIVIRVRALNIPLDGFGKSSAGVELNHPIGLISSISVGMSNSIRTTIAVDVFKVGVNGSTGYVAHGGPPIVVSVIVARQCRNIPFLNRAKSGAGVELDIPVR